MLFRFILWMILIFFAVKIIGSALQYLRRLLTPNQHIKNSGQRRYVRDNSDVEDIPYEDVSKKE